MIVEKMFEKCEIQYPGMKIDCNAERVECYGRMDNDMVYRIVRRTKGLCTDPPLYIDVIKKDNNNGYEWIALKNFLDEKQATTCRIKGKRYKEAMEYAEEYIQGFSTSLYNPYRNKK